MAVVDASVYVAALNPGEPGFAESRAWLAQATAENEPLRAPAILLAEVAAAIRRGTNDVNLAQQGHTQLREAGLIHLVPVTIALAERAAIIAADHSIRGCDAVYIAVAEETGEDLVTLDQQQLERGGAVVSARRP